MIGRPFSRNRWKVAALAAGAGVALFLACETPSPTSDRQVVTPTEATKTLTVAPLMKVDENCTPAYVLNGKKVDDKAIAALSPDEISSISVYKGARAIEEAQALHLDAGCGVIKVYTKDAPTYSDQKIPNPPPERALKEYREQRNVADAPTFTPFTVRPELTNKTEIAKALEKYYPPLLKDAGIGGRTLVWFFIDENGVVQKVQMGKSSGHPALDQAALKVAKSMKFSAAKNRDENVPVWVEIPIVFQTQE